MKVILDIFGLSAISLLSVYIFTAVLLARVAGGEFLLTHIFYAATWTVFTEIARRMESGRRREAFLGISGPLSPGQNVFAVSDPFQDAEDKPA